MFEELYYSSHHFALRAAGTLIPWQVPGGRVMLSVGTLCRAGPAHTRKEVEIDVVAETFQCCLSFLHSQA